MNQQLKWYLFYRRKLRVTVRWGRRFLFRIVVPGTNGGRLTELLEIFVDQILHCSLTLSASAMAFNFFLAIFPAFIFIFSLIPFIGINNLEAEINTWIAKALPPKVVILISGVMSELFKKKGFGLVSVSFIVVIYSSTRGLNTMIEAFRKMDPDFTPQLNFLPQYGRALLLFIVLFVFSILAIGANVFVVLVIDNVFHLFPPIKGFLHYVLEGVDKFAEVLAVLITISVVYTSAKDSHIRVGFISAGSLLASVLMILAIQILGYLFSSFINYNRFYGSLAAVIALMVWLYWISIVLLLGYNLNVALRNLASKRAVVPYR